MSTTLLASDSMEVPAWYDDDFLGELASYLLERNLQDKLMVGVRDKYLQFGSNAKTVERNFDG